MYLKLLTTNPALNCPKGKLVKIATGLRNAKLYSVVLRIVNFAILFLRLTQITLGVRKMLEQNVDNLTSAICSLIEALGMQAENKNREHKGESPAYAEQTFLDLIYKHNLTGF